MKVLYLPLDERPCNAFYPQMIARLQPNLSLITPPVTLLGQKKQAANVDQLWAWVQASAKDCDVAILSIELWVYGGLLPSRLHYDSPEHLQQRLQRIRDLKQTCPNLRLLASNLIMRTPTYNSSEEEPDYYATYGTDIFQWGWLTDKQNREGLTPPEQDTFAQLNASLPQDYLNDYRTRRTHNLTVNQATIDLVKDGILEFLAIPQDDSAPYGFTALDQEQVIRKIEGDRLQHQIHLYPGADEVGCTLLARAYGQLKATGCKLYLCFSAVQSEQIVPLYEDRPLGESLKSHILAAGATVVPHPEGADVILAVNTAGKVMQEAWDQDQKDITYSSYRNLRFFVHQIAEFMAAGKPVAIADVAFANGGETELIQLLDHAQLWDDLLAYGGWNTNCNTMGTVLATAILGYQSNNPGAIQFNKIHHLLEDWAYQSQVRSAVVEEYLPTIGASYYDFNHQEPQVLEEIRHRMLNTWDHTFKHSFRQWQIQSLTLHSPWHRMFEIGMTLILNNQTPACPPDPFGDIHRKIYP